MPQTSHFLRSLEVFWHFFLLGWTSFGGPMAHLGYFRQRFVVELKWLSEADYSQLIALSQFLPGPGSSQVGFAIGHKQAGIFGAWMAFIGFTLPSFLLLFWVAVYQPETENIFYQQMLIGLKLLAVVVVADATLGMFSKLCQSKITQITAVITAVILLLFPFGWLQVALLGLAFLIGWYFIKTAHPTDPTNQPHLTSKRPLLSLALLAIGFGILLMNAFMPNHLPNLLQIFSDFAQAGILVFGGGHVVLPLLQNAIGEPIGEQAFLSGYALAQAVPGPMFTVASYYGALLFPTMPFMGALAATLGIFVPGLLLILVLKNSWQNWAEKPKVQSGIQLLNASVVGLLIATLFNPVFSSAVNSNLTMAWVLIGFAVLRIYRISILWLVALFALGYPSFAILFLS